MKLLIEIIVYAIAVLLLIPSLVLFVECSMAMLPTRSFSKKPKISAPSPEIKVLIPAHNEALVIGSTLASLIPQVPSPESIVVVADNCTDKTVEIAKSFGVQVIERIEPAKRGKGYALEFGLRFLEFNPPDVVIINDADCQVEEGAISQLATMALSSQKPVQATYIMEKPANSKPQDIVSALAFMIKNQVRITGLARMGLPCLLTGTGMAFPWCVIKKVQWGNANLVEDMQVAIDLAIVGYAPRFCPAAKVIGILPQHSKAATTQRTRWEHGHVQTLLKGVPRLLWEAIVQKRFELFTLALELGVPPLSLLVMIWSLVLIIAVVQGLWTGVWLTTGILCVAGLVIFTAIMGAWFKFGRTNIPAFTLLSIPIYLLGKIPLYIMLLIKPEKEWVRTQREYLGN